MRFENDDLKLTQVDEGSSIGVRVFKDSKLGFSSTNQADDASLETAARDALELSSFNPADKFNVLPAPRPVQSRPSLVRPEMAALEVGRVVEIARDLSSRAAACDPRISVDQATAELVRVNHAVSSGGRGGAASLGEADCQLSFHVFGMAVDGDDVGGFHYCGDSLREVSEIEPALARCIAEFSETVLGNLGAGAAETYQGPVLFSPSALLEILVSPLVSAASAIAVQRGRSAMAGKLGETVANPVLSVIDDPTDVTLSGAGSFDREGQPATRFELVTDGVLKSYLYNGYAAAVEGVTSTGHASGGARSVPGLGPHALCVAPGTGGTRDDLLKSLDRGLFVQRFSGTVDAASGDFSGVAKSARWVENGVITRSVRETLLSGNAFDLLKGGLTLSTELERLHGSVRAPFAIVDGLNVTAG